MKGRKEEGCGQGEGREERKGGERQEGNDS